MTWIVQQGRMRADGCSTFWVRMHKAGQCERYETKRL